MMNLETWIQWCVGGLYVVSSADQRWPWWPLLPIISQLLNRSEGLVPALFLGFCAIGIDGVQLRHRGLDGFLKLAWNAFPIDWL